MQIIQALKKNEIEDIASLAQEIWTEHYTFIIGIEQVNYMIKQFQSTSAITTQIQEDGYDYFILQEQGEKIGYIGLQVQEEKLFLSKIYLKKEQRGKGYSKQAFDFMKQYAKEHNCTEIYLTVNKRNHTSIATYKKSGFHIVKSVTADIGNGYVMDDYIMSKEY